MINRCWSNITSFIIDSIEVNNYVYIELDEYYIHCFDNYQKHHNFHTVLIYGYNTASKEFYASDFFALRKYSYETLSFDEVYDGYINIKDSYFLNGVYLYEKSNRYYVYEYSRETLISNLQEYLRGDNPKRRNMIINYPYIKSYHPGNVYGINIYKSLCDSILQNHHENIDIRAPYVLMSHKTVLLYITKSLVNKGLVVNPWELHNNLKHIEEMCRKNVMLVLKYNINKNDEIKERIVSNYELIQNEEIILIKNIIESIREKPNNIICSNTSLYSDGIGLRCNCESYSNMTYYLSYPSHYVQATFYGNTFRYYADVGTIYGTACVLVDGNEYGHYSLYSSKLCRDMMVIEICDLEDTLHTVRVIPKKDSLINIKKFHVSSFRTINTRLPYIKSDFTFLGIDNHTGSKWMNVYGCSGYIIPSIDCMYPPYGDVHFPNQQVYYNETVTKKNFLLDSPPPAKERKINCCYCSDTAMELSIFISGNSSHRVSIYLIDWSDDNSLCGEIIIKNPYTNEEIHKYAFNNLDSGIYLSYEFYGYYKLLIKMNDKGRIYGDLYGLFFD